MRDPATGALPIESFKGSAEEVAAAHYDLLLPRFTELVDQVDGGEDLWRAERDTLDTAERAFDAGTLRIEDVPAADLAVVWIPSAWNPAFSAACCSATPQYIRWPSIAAPTDGGSPTSTRRIETFGSGTDSRAGYSSRLPKPAGQISAPIAQSLTEADPEPGDWIANGRKTFLAWLRRRDDRPSGLDADTFLQVLTDGLVAAAISWHPYDPRP